MKMVFQLFSNQQNVIQQIYNMLGLLNNITQHHNIFFLYTRMRMPVGNENKISNVWDYFDLG